MSSKTWLLTDASAGLGRELVTAALARGDRVVAASRRPERLDDLARDHGDPLLAVALDVTDPDAAQYIGHEPGDPARAAKTLTEIVDTEQPPRRLLLGSRREK